MMYVILNGHKWRTTYKNKTPYLTTGHTIYFHRYIMNSPDKEIDHIDRDTHNNRRSNLRTATRQEQIYNTIHNSKTNIKGVYFASDGRNKPWHSECQLNGKRYHSPYYFTKEEAVYFRYLFENKLLKDFKVANNDAEIKNCINKLTEKQKESIQNYFNKMKI